MGRERTLYREPRGGGDVSLQWDGERWTVLDMIADTSTTRRHRFWIIAFLDYITR
jgi:hypothetical protein